MEKCDICFREREVFVRASVCSPTSWGYCQDCIDNNAEDIGIVNTFFISAEQSKPTIYWGNGQYMQWEKYSKLLNHDIKKKYFQLRINLEQILNQCK